MYKISQECIENFSIYSKITRGSFFWPTRYMHIVNVVGNQMNNTPTNFRRILHSQHGIRADHPKNNTLIGMQMGYIMRALNVPVDVCCTT